MRHQPGKGWDSTITYCGWREIPSVYIAPEEDKLIPIDIQELVAGMASSKMVRVKGAGHMLQLSRTTEVASIIEDAIVGVL